ncbi:MAG: hypothetical protein RLZZ608_625 [Actinomycetota bacterium]
MARRRELADAADGISGLVVSNTPWFPDWPMGDVGRAVQAGKGREFTFDLLSGTATPPLTPLIVRATRLREELARHLAARRIPEAWVSEASVTVSVVDGVQKGFIAVRCRVAITDDLGREYTSTRKASAPLPRQSWWRLLRSVFTDRRLAHPETGSGTDTGRAWQHPFDSLLTKGGRARAGDVAGRAVLLVPYSWSSWELHDRPWEDPEGECVDSYWTGDATSVGVLASWDIEWVQPAEVKQFADHHFPGLDQAIVWKHHGDE